jgi:hypothetical protein
MTDYGTLKLSNGHLAVRNGRLAKGPRTPACVATACRLCAGATGYWRTITLADIDCTWEACIAVGGQSINVSATPSVLPDGDFLLAFSGNIPAEYYSGDGLEELVDPDIAQASLFQGGDTPYEEKHCLWVYDTACTGEWKQYYADTTCSGIPHTFTIQYLRIELKLFKTQWRIEGYYDGYWTDPDIRTRLYFAYGVEDRAGDTEQIDFDAIHLVSPGPFANGTATVVAGDDPIIQDGLAQKSLTDDPIFQGDIY